MEDKYCLSCGLKLKSNRKRTKFCNHSCSAKHNNAKRADRATCYECKSSFNRRGRIERKFCGKRCEVDFKKKFQVDEWKCGRIVGHNQYGLVKPFVRNYLITTRGEKCEICGWSERHEITNKVPLQVDHIDGNAYNTIESNLQLLCPNHHALTRTYGALNKGSGRTKRPSRNAGFV